MIWNKLDYDFSRELWNKLLALWTKELELWCYEFNEYDPLWVIKDELGQLINQLMILMIDEGINEKMNV